jgi:hypothetical protein
MSEYCGPLRRPILLTEAYMVFGRDEHLFIMTPVDEADDYVNYAGDANTLRVDTITVVARRIIRMDDKEAIDDAPQQPAARYDR